MPVSRTRQHAVFLMTMARFESSLRRQVVMDKNRFVRKCAALYADTKQPDFFHLADEHQQEIFDTLTDHYRRIIPAFGSISLTQIKSRQYKDSEEDDLFSQLTDYWINTEGLKRSRLIADTTEADVLAAISGGMDAGDGVAAIARRISKVTGLSGFRAELIARTETHAAANYGSIESVRHAQDNLGVTMVKQWMPTMDARTRPDHAAMASYGSIAMDEKFMVGGELMDRPGDPSADASQSINCRCTLVYFEA